MGDFVTPPIHIKKKNQFWPGFTAALTAELQRRQALKDAMEQLKAQSDLALQRSQDLATFNINEGVRAAELGAPAEAKKRQSIFDTAQFGQDLTPDVVGAVASPEEQYKYTGVIPSQTQGPPTPEAEAIGIGGVMAQMRKRAAEMKQNVIQTPEDIAKQETKREEQERKAEADKLTDVQRQAYAQANIRLRFQLRENAKGEGVDTKVIDKATAAYNARYNTAIGKWTKPEQAQQMAQEAFDSVIDIYRSYGINTPDPVPVDDEDKDGVAETDTTGVVSLDPHEEEKVRLTVEYRTATPERKKAIAERLLAIRTLNAKR